MGASNISADQDQTESVIIAAAWFKGVQRHICLDYNDTVNKFFQKCFTNGEI